MTDLPAPGRCQWCGRAFDIAAGPGRPRKFCRAGCRQADYVARLRRAELGISEAELIVTRQALNDLQDRLYVLEAAVEDVDRDLGASDGAEDLREALDWLLAACRPLCGSLNLT